MRYYFAAGIQTLISLTSTITLNWWLLYNLLDLSKFDWYSWRTTYKVEG